MKFSLCAFAVAAVAVCGAAPTNQGGNSVAGFFNSTNIPMGPMGSGTGAKGLRIDKGPPGIRALVGGIKSKGFVDVISKSANGTDGQRFRFRASTNGVPSLRASYQTGSDDAKPGFEYKVGFLALVEYNDTITWKNSTSKYRLAGRNDKWSSWTSTNSSTANATIVSYWSTLTDGATPLTIKFGFDVTTTNTALESVSLRPNAVKYTLVIQNYPYALANGKLAIVKALYTRSSVARALGTDGKLEVGTAGRIDWTNSVIIDKTTGETANVIIDSKVDEQPASADAKDSSDDNKLEDTESASIALFRFNATKAAYIEWDPEMALSSESSAYVTSDAGHIMSSLFAFAVIPFMMSYSLF